MILDEVQKQLQTISAPYCIVVIPLLFETMLTHTYPISTPYNFLDRILVVDTSVSLQLQRASARDKTEISIIQAIINTQVTREQRLAHAQDVIINDGKLEDLLRQVERLHKKYLTLYSVT